MMNSRVRHLVELLLPAGVSRYMAYKSRLQRIAYAHGNIWTAAASHQIRNALLVSRLSHFPPAIVQSLDCVVDVGAHFGLWSEAVLTIASPKELVAIEPHEPSYCELASRMHKHPNVTVLKYAVSDSMGTSMMNVFSSPDFNSVLQPARQISDYYGGVRVIDQVPVSTMTLDRLLHDRKEISILKVDVQGSEASVFQGARSTLQRTRSILLEMNFATHYEGEAGFTDLHTLLTNEFHFVLYQFASFYPAEDGRVLWADAVFIQS